MRRKESSLEMIDPCMYRTKYQYVLKEDQPFPKNPTQLKESLHKNIVDWITRYMKSNGYRSDNKLYILLEQFDKFYYGMQLWRAARWVDENINSHSDDPNKPIIRVDSSKTPLNDFSIVGTGRSICVTLIMRCLCTNIIFDVSFIYHAVDEVMVNIRKVMFNNESNVVMDQYNISSLTADEGYMNYSYSFLQNFRYDIAKKAVKDDISKIANPDYNKVIRYKHAIEKLFAMDSEYSKRFNLGKNKDGETILDIDGIIKVALDDEEAFPGNKDKLSQLMDDTNPERNYTLTIQGPTMISSEIMCQVLLSIYLESYLLDMYHIYMYMSSIGFSEANEDAAEVVQELIEKHYNASMQYEAALTNLPTTMGNDGAETIKSIIDMAPKSMLQNKASKLMDKYIPEWENILNIPAKFLLYGYESFIQSYIHLTVDFDEFDRLKQFKDYIKKFDYLDFMKDVKDTIRELQKECRVAHGLSPSLSNITKLFINSFSLIDNSLQNAFESMNAMSNIAVHIRGADDDTEDDE